MFGFDRLVIGCVKMRKVFVKFDFVLRKVDYWLEIDIYLVVI